MNKTLLGVTPLVLLLSVYPALAAVGGESLYFEFERCEHLTVNINPCEPNEWTANGCTEQSTGNWHCGCHDNYQLNLTPAVNSFGTFTITMTNYYNGYSQPSMFYGGVTWEYPSHEEDFEDFMEPVINGSASVSVSEELGIVTDVEAPSQEADEFNWLIPFLIASPFLGFSVYLEYLRRKKNKYKKE